jgi:CO/xanthine dehydrogenase Mo-binding subunit
MADRWIGSPVARVEDDRLVRGAGRYVDDITPVGALHAAFVRAPYAHARIVDVDVSGVLAVDGVVAVYLAEDLGDLNRPLPLTIPNPGLTQPRTQLPLAESVVNFVGEPVAMVIAEDRYLAEDAATSIEVTYEQLPVAATLEAAAAGAGPVHADVPDNVAARLLQLVGDPEQELERSPHRLSLSLKVERSAATPLEGRGVVATVDPTRGHLTVYCSTQSPSTIKAGLSVLLGMPEFALDVIAPDIGGGFGVKLPVFYPEEVLVPFAARQLGRPVKWTEDRREHFVGSNHERAQIHEVEVGFDDDGRIRALVDRFTHDSGAYCPYGVIVPLVTTARLLGPYRVPAYRSEATVLYTNALPVSPYRGAGMPQGAFVMERTIDAIARELELDRAEVRSINFIDPDEFPYNQQVIDEDGTEMIYDSGQYEKGLQLAMERIGYEDFAAEQQAAREQGRLIGLGIGCYVEGTGSGPYEGVRVHVEPTGKISVATGTSAQGQGHETFVAQIVADRLGVDYRDVVVTTGDTSRFKWATGTFASRVGVVVGGAAAKAGEAVRAKALEVAAHALEADPQDLEIVDGVIGVRGVKDQTITLRQVAILANPLRYAFSAEAIAATQFVSDSSTPPPPMGESPGLEASRFNVPPHATFASGAHAAIVEVDPETGVVSILRYVAIHDCGKMVNPAIVEGQVRGGVAQGIGGALYERMEYDPGSGQLLNASFMDFLMPYASEIPYIEVDHVETPSPLNELGMKGAGEAGALLPPAVIASAVEDAVGAPVVRVPLTPGDVLELVDAGGLTTDKAVRTGAAGA